MVCSPSLGNVGGSTMRKENSRWLHLLATALIAVVSLGLAGVGYAQDQSAPAPLLAKGQPPVSWWFVFKFNTKSFPGCWHDEHRSCLFGGTRQNYREGFSQQFVYASNKNPKLQMGHYCLGDTTSDPVGATFDEAYNGNYYYVIWNDQFYKDPDLKACNHKTFCVAPWAHSKGMLVWDDDGNGFVMQVSTPNWPGAGSKNYPRQHNGNTLGCLTDVSGKPKDNILFSQHFFASKLNEDDVLKVLHALQKAQVVTRPNAEAGSPSRIVRNGGPEAIQDLVSSLGSPSDDTEASEVTLSDGVELIAKPPALHVPPWQMVSGLLGHAPLRVATWLTGRHKIPNTTAGKPECWDSSLPAPAAVTNAVEGHWKVKEQDGYSKNVRFGLKGAVSPDRNHAKIGVSTTGDYAIFGDLNQEGALSEPCNVPQNTRGGLFFVVRNEALAKGLRSLMTDPTPGVRSHNSAKRHH